MALIKHKIEGRTINFRNAQIDDAAFILKLRTDPQLNIYLNRTNPDLNEQKLWIKNCQENTGQYYFIIEDKEQESVGTVRLYDFKADSFCWGSWIIQPNSPRKAAIESALLVYELGFYELGFQKSHFDVRKENAKVIEFHKRYGAKIIEETDKDCFFIFTRKNYEFVRDQYRQFLPI